MSADETIPRALDMAARAGELERLFDAALDAVIAMDGDGAIAAWNRTAETMFGWTGREVLGRQLAETIIPASLRAAHYAGLERYRATGGGPVINSRVEVSAIRRDGTEFPVELTVIPLQFEAGEIFYAFVRDITERRRAEKLAEQRALEAQVLYEAASLVAQGGTADALLALCMAKICEVTGWTVGHVYLPDDRLNPSRLLPSDIWHFAEERLAELRAATSDYTFTKGEGLPGRIWATGAPAWIEDIHVDTNLPRRELLIGHGLRAAFGVPIVLEGQIQAVLEFFSPIAKRPDDTLLLVARSLTEQLGRVLERQRGLEHQQLLMRELDHRVSNSMTIVASVFRRTAEGAETVAEVKNRFEAQLQTLAGAHHILARGAWTSADLRAVIETTLAGFATEGTKYRLAGPAVHLPARQVIDLAIVLHELAANAAKYGALAVLRGKVAISWRETGEAGSPQLEIDWRESGSPPLGEPRQGGRGLKLIERLITRGMGGRFHVDFRPAGLHATIAIPIGGWERRQPIGVQFPHEGRIVSHGLP